MPLLADTLTTVRHELARGMSDMVTQGIAASGFASTSSLESGDIVQQRSNQLRGHNIYFYSGAQSTLERLITAFTPYSVAGQRAKVDVLPAWSVAPSVNTLFEVHRLFKAAQYNEEIQRAVARVQRRQLVTKNDRSLVVNSRILNPMFAYWENGAALAPDSWTLAGTGAAVARESSLIHPGAKYSAKVTNGASQAAYLSQAIADYPRFSGLKCSVQVQVFCATASRVRICLKDGTNTWYSSYHDAEGKESLEILDKTLADAITELTLELRTETGTAIDAYWLKVLLVVGDDVYEYPLSEYPTKFVYVDSVYLEGDDEGVFEVQVPDDYWHIDRYSKRLVLMRGLVSPGAEQGKVIEVRGQVTAAIPDAETDTVDVDNSYVIARAGSQLLGTLPWGTLDSEGLQSRYAAWRADADRLELMMQTRPVTNARPVEEL